MPRAKVGASHEDERSAAAGHEEAVGRLRAIPNVGPKMAAELVKLGVTRLEDAASRDPDEMYHELCAIDAKKHDPCVRDVLAAVVSYAEGGPARPWWEFTPERKAQEQTRGEGLL